MKRLQNLSSIPDSRRGVSLPEVLVVIAIIGLLVGLLGPAIQQTRERGRVLSCRDRMRQLVIACHSHESFHQSFPATSTYWLEPTNAGAVLRLPISAHRHLMAHLDVNVFREIDFTDATAPLVVSTPPTSLSAKNNALLRRTVSLFLCPSETPQAGATNYRCNMGASVEILVPSPGASSEPLAASGAFVNGRSVHLSEIRDGLSQTALWSERVLGDGNPSQYSPFRDRYSPTQPVATTQEAISICRDFAVAVPASHDSYMGWDWLLGGRIHTWYFHVAVPNSTTPDCSHGSGTFSTDGGPGLYSARSLHTGGVNVAFADGSARLVSSTIDLNVWQALGTRNGSEHFGGFAP